MPRLHSTRSSLLLLPALAAVLRFAGCGANDGPQAPASPSPSATAAGTNGTPAASPTASPSATTAPGASDVPWAVPVHAPGTRTGVDIVDRVIAAAEAGDVATLVTLAAFRDVECEDSETGMHPYQCPPGVPDGTLVSAVSAAYSERTFISPDGMEQAIAEAFFRLLGQGADLALRLYAVAELDEDPFEAGSTYRVLLAFPDGTGRQLWVSADGIAVVWFGCGNAPVTEMTVISSAGAQPNYLLSPLTR